NFFSIYENYANMKLRRNARMVLSFYGISIPIFSLFVSHIVKCGAFFIIVVFEKQILSKKKEIQEGA
ncbi:hypothetical protein ABE325_22165, partial [Bacillus licheniformis]